MFIPGDVRRLQAEALKRHDKSVEHPPVVPEPVFATHAEWAAGAQSTYDCEGGRGDRWQRSVYMMQGFVVFLETYTPWNPFEKPGVSMIVESFNVPEDSEEMRLAAKYGGKWENGYYAEIGFGWPRFWGEDCTEKCWAFLEEHNKRRKEKCA